MNNDISRELKYHNVQKINYNNQQNNNSANGEMCEKTQQELDSTAISNSMECLNALGCAQISMTECRTRKSCEEFLKNPLRAKAYVDFSDGLVENGYKLEDAIAIADCIFEDIK